MTKYKFIKLLNERIQTGALKYLLGKQGVKGQEISYSRIQLSDYLLPTNDKQTIEQKRRLFAIRNKMVNIPSNFSSSKTKIICYCGDVEFISYSTIQFWYTMEALRNKLKYITFLKINLKEEQK